jgi:hypothetical protein
MSTSGHVCPHQGLIHKIEKDMYHGNGKPGITTRLEVLEGDVLALTVDMTAVKRMFWAVILLLITILGAVISQRH